MEDAAQLGRQQQRACCPLSQGAAPAADQGGTRLEEVGSKGINLGS